jgi:anti-sigma factor RsiW
MSKEAAVPCDDRLRVQAYFDGELDAAVSLDVERHVENCVECAMLLKDLHGMRETMRHATYHRAPSPLRSSVMQALDREAGPRAKGSVAIGGKSFWRGAGAGALVTALAASLVLFIALPPKLDGLQNELTSAHLRSLMPDHLIDVVSSDQHTVKPWFAGHADVSPPTPDFPQEDYRLIGGRADYIDGQRAAVVVYRHGAHVINVFAWARHGESLPQMTTRNGYHTACWRSGDLSFCAVSDTGVDELMRLVDLLKDAAARENRE